MTALEEMVQRLKNEISTPKNWTDYSTGEDVCPICKNSGWETYEENGYTFCRECRCGIRQRKIMDNRLSFANIPESFKNMRLSSFNAHIYKNTESQNKAVNAVKIVNYWLDDFDRMNERGMGLYLYSQAKGSGKTMMAASVSNELIYQKRIQVKFATSLQILSEIKKSWEKTGGESILLEHLCSTEVLVIDDFGTERAKDWIEERFYQIVNSRYIDKKITIFTSNMNLNHLNYDERITNRIKERTFQIPFPEESVRDMIAEENLMEMTQNIRTTWSNFPE